MKKEEKLSKRERSLWKLAGCIAVLAGCAAATAFRRKEQICMLEGQLLNQKDLIVGLERSIERLAYGLGKRDGML